MALTVKTPVAAVPATLVTPVPLSWGLLLAYVAAYTTPTAVRLAPPVAVTLPPRVAVEEPILALVGVVIVGVPTGVTAEEALEALPVPTLFVAVTVKV